MSGPNFCTMLRGNDGLTTCVSDLQHVIYIIVWLPGIPGGGGGGGGACIPPGAGGGGGGGGAEEETHNV